LTSCSGPDTPISHYDTSPPSSIRLL
jgi:hypothetical protein